MSGAIERYRKRQPDRFAEQAEASQLALLGIRNQGALGLAAIEVAAYVTYSAMNASYHVHAAADHFASRAPSCAEGVEMMAQSFDLSAAMRIQSIANPRGY